MKKGTWRLPDDLYEQVKAQASEHHRSMNAEITVVLAAYVARQTKSKRKEEKKKGSRSTDGL